jgi:hypothetical protein
MASKKRAALSSELLAARAAKRAAKAARTVPKRDGAGRKKSKPKSKPRSKSKSRRTGKPRVRVAANSNTAVTPAIAAATNAFAQKGAASAAAFRPWYWRY